MAVPWMRILDTVIGVTDLAWSRRGGRRQDTEDDRALAVNGGNSRAFANLEARLAGVVVAALKEAFDRDTVLAILPSCDLPPSTSPTY